MLDTGLVVCCMCVNDFSETSVRHRACLCVPEAVLVAVFVGDNVFNDMCERHSVCLDMLKTCT